jgi:hypothetical protein
MANLKRIGYGQVEPNQLSGQHSKQIYGQLPAADTITQIENGQFAKYDYANGNVNTAAATDGEYMLVFNEVKLYDDFWRESYKDFCLKTTQFTDGKIYPRLYKTQVGDIITTNCFASAAASGVAEVDMGVADDADVTDGIYFAVNANGFLAKADSKPASGMVWKAVKIYTMPDGTPGIKIQRIQ